MENFTNPEIMKALPLSEKIGDSLITMGLGMGITFLVLIGLMFSIILMSRVLAPKPVVEEKKEPAATPPQTVVQESAAADDTLEIVAVITAALMQMRAGSGMKLKIQSIRAAGEQHPIWYQAGMQQNMKVR